MSEYQRILNESKNPANWQDTPDPAAVAAVDAFRAAIVAQTALLRTISEQIRLGQAATNGALDGLASTIGHFYGDSGEALAGLAERLEKLEHKLTSVDEKATLWAAVNPIHLSGKHQQPKRTHRLAARRKAKR